MIYRFFILILTCFSPLLLFAQEEEAGHGFFMPNLFEQQVLYFYGAPNLEKSLLEHYPTDSLVFARTELGIEIKYAPPWLVPHHLKLDYDILYFRVSSVADDLLQVIVNKQTGQSAYVARSAGRLVYWPDFLLSMNSVECADPDAQVFVKPLPHAGLALQKFDLMRPMQIRGEWMQVALMDQHYKKVGKGWIRWKEGDRLLITYSLFS